MHPMLPVPGVGGVPTPGAASESSPALDGPSVVLPESPLRPSCLLACVAPSLRSLRFPGLSSSSPSSGRLCVHRPSVPSFLGRRHPHPRHACGQCVRPLRVCARQSECVRAWRRRYECVCELVSAWLTKAWACGEPREGRGGSVPPGDPGCGLQLALAEGLETPPSASWRLRPEAGHKPGGAHGVGGV